MRFFRGFASQTRGKLAAVRAVFTQALVLRAQGKYDCELPTGGREDAARSGSAFVRGQLVLDTTLQIQAHVQFS